MGVFLRCQGMKRNGSISKSEGVVRLPQLTPLVIVALGANLGDSKRIIIEAAKELQKLSDEPLLHSSLWETSPIDCPAGSPPFVNAVIGFLPRPGETPETLLERLQSLEKAFGRTPKKIMNEARVLDLDLIAFGRQTRATDELTLPHPRAHLRRFVLEPLCEIYPEFVFPGQTKTVSELLGGLPMDERMRRIE